MSDAERPTERAAARAAELADAAVGTVTDRTWGSALSRLGQWADELDHVRSLPAAGPSGISAGTDGPGPAASGWALVKAAATMATVPVTLPVLAVSARMATASCKNRNADFPAHLRAVAEGRPPLLPSPRNLRIPALAITVEFQRASRADEAIAVLARERELRRLAHALLRCPW